MARILVLDTTLRDGEHTPGAVLTPGEKLRMAHEIEALEVDIIDAGIPGRSADGFEGVRRIAQSIRRPVISALSRTGDEEIRLVAAALEGAARSRIHVVHATSDLQLRRMGISRDQCIDRVGRAVRRAREYSDDVQFSASDGSRSDPDFLAAVVAVALAAGAGTINIPDSMGHTLPGEYGALMMNLLEGVPSLSGAVLSAHCHDDLGLAVANTLAAVQAGARQVECTLTGIGERAGNAALEEVVMALHLRRERLGHDTGVRLNHIHRACRFLSALTGLHSPPNKAVVGSGAFAVGAREEEPGAPYPLMSPAMVGHPGDHPRLRTSADPDALRDRYAALGYELEEDELERAHRLMLVLATQKKEILDEDLLAILHHGTWSDVPSVWKLEFLEVTCGAAMSSARVVLIRDGTPTREAQAEGDGPLAAAFAAVDQLTDAVMELEDLQIRAATPGRDAVGEANLRARVRGRSFAGHAADTDVVTASVRAYLQVLDKAEHATTLEARELEKYADMWGV